MTARDHAARPAIGIALLAALLLTLLLPARPAHACSCMMVEPESRLQEVPAAFVGTLRSVSADAGQSRFEFEVEAVMAGELPPTLELVGPEGDGANCGLMLETGARAGLFLHATDQGWSSSSCDTVDADQLLAAGEPREPEAALVVDRGFSTEDTGATPWVAVGATALAAAGILGLVVWFVRRDGIASD